MSKGIKRAEISKEKSAQVFTQVRIDEKTFLKGKILAAVYDISFNRLMVDAIRHEIELYEEVNGPLPKPDPKADEAD